MKIVPSGRIDYCVECDKDHGYDCPKDVDGIMIKSIKKPFRFWWWLRNLFKRPRFSKESLEPAEKLSDKDLVLEWDKLAHGKGDLNKIMEMSDISGKSRYFCEECHDTGIIKKTEWTDTDTSYEVEIKCKCREE